MKVTGNGVCNLQHNTTLFKSYKILSGKLTTCFCFANLSLPIPSTTYTTGRSEEDLQYYTQY